jgi:hypothetical protein
MLVDDWSWIDDWSWDCLWMNRLGRCDAMGALKSAQAIKLEKIGKSQFRRL